MTACWAVASSKHTLCSGFCIVQQFVASFEDEGRGAAAELGGPLHLIEDGDVNLDEPPRIFRTALYELFHAASCRFRCSSWTSCGVR